MGHTHALFGVTAYVALPLVGVPAPLTGIGWAAGAALLPDIDHPSSTVSKFAGPVGRFFRWASGAKHRGLTHTWPFAAVVVALVALWRPHLLIPIGCGYSSHLIGDVTFDGRKSFRPKTGGFVENRLVTPGLWVVLAGLLAWRWVGM